MTAIAYRSGILASDSAVYGGTTLHGYATKLASAPDGSIAGASGTSSICAYFLSHFRDGTEADFAPKVTGDDSLSAIVIRPDGSVWHVDDTGRYNVHAEFYAEGNASAMVLGAMAAGATAEEAVAIAIKYNGTCGGVIQVLRIEGLIPETSALDSDWKLPPPPSSPLIKLRTSFDEQAPAVRIDWATPPASRFGPLARANRQGPFWFPGS